MCFKITTTLSIFLWFIHSSLTLTFPGENDQVVETIPGLANNKNLLYRHFSGYLNVDNNTFLHYWFFESRTGHAEKDPVVLWLNGGPGITLVYNF